MTVNPSLLGGFAAQFFDNNGVILSGGKIYTYAAGTTTPQATYTSVSGATAHTNPIILDSAGRVPGGELWLTNNLAYKIVIETALSVLIGTYDNVFSSDATLRADLAASSGSSLVGSVYTTYASRTVAQSVTIPASISTIQTQGYATANDRGAGVYKRLSGAPSTDSSNNGYFQDVSGAWFGITNPEGEDLAAYQFGAVGDGVTNDFKAVQDGMNYTFNVLYCSFYVPEGTFYLSNTLIMPGRTNCDTVPPGPTTPDNRHQMFKFYGGGIGESYAIFGGRPAPATPTPYNERGGTKLVGATGKTVLACDTCYPLGGSSGMEITGFAFIGDSGIAGANTGEPVVDLRLVQNSSFHHNVIYQAGDADGLLIRMCYQTDIAWNRIFNRFWATPGSGSAQTGVGIKLLNPYSPSQITISNNTSKGFHDAGIFGDPTLTYREYQLLFLYNEASTCYNGWTFHGCDGAVVTGNYVEGSEGGFGIKDRSREAVYTSNFFFEGNAVCFDLTDTNSRGAKCLANRCLLGSKVNAIGIDVTNDNSFGFSVSLCHNHFERTAGVAGQIGIKLTGPPLAGMIAGNEYSPRFAWTGAGSFKVSNALTGEGFVGLIEVDDIDSGFQIQGLTGGAVSFLRGALTQANVTANVLAIGPKNYYKMSASGATTVNSITRSVSGDATNVQFRLLDANTTFAHNASMRLDGGANFTGPGILNLMFEQNGATIIAYEISRSVVS